MKSLSVDFYFIPLTTNWMAGPSLLIVSLWELAFDSIGFSVGLDFISSFEYLD